ncbi:hypothetical protein BHE74_00045771, partial [Ensete ventricosum]
CRNLLLSCTLPPRQPLFLPSSPHDTTTFSLIVAALAVAVALKHTLALLSSSIATASHSSPSATTSVTALATRQPLVTSSRANSLCSNRCPSPTTQTHAPNSTAEKRTEYH